MKSSRQVKNTEFSFPPFESQTTSPCGQAGWLRSAACLLLLIVLSVPLPAKGEPAVFLGFQAAPDVPASLTKSTAGELRLLLARTKGLDLWPEEDYEKGRQDLPARLRGDCRGKDCLVEIGQALGLAFIVHARVQRAGEQYELEVRLLDVALEKDFAANVFMRPKDVKRMMEKVVAQFGDKVPEFERGRHEKKRQEKLRVRELADLQEEREEKLSLLAKEKEKMRREKEKAYEQRRKERAKKRRERYEQKRRQLMDEAGIKGGFGIADAIVIIPAFCGTAGLVVGMISHFKMQAEADELAGLTNENFRPAQERSVASWRGRRNLALTIGAVGGGLSVAAFIWYKKTGHSFTLRSGQDGVKLARVIEF